MTIVSIDIKTLGTVPGSVITSIAGVAQRNGKLGEFKVNIDIQSCLDAGLTVDGSTIEFWLQQNDKARESILDGNRSSLEKALKGFIWWLGFPESKRVFTKGPEFDIAMLQVACSKFGLTLPVERKEVLSIRNLVDEFPEIEMDWSGTAHDPLEDAKRQLKFVNDCEKARYSKN